MVQVKLQPVCTSVDSSSYSKICLLKCNLQVVYFDSAIIDCNIAYKLHILLQSCFQLQALKFVSSFMPRMGKESPRHIILCRFLA